MVWPHHSRYHRCLERCRASPGAQPAILLHSPEVEVWITKKLDLIALAQSSRLVFDRIASLRHLFSWNQLSLLELVDQGATI
jgi:hypothetical protein